MGKTKKLYPVRRILAVMLAVAMSVTMIPSTALAAPADDSGLHVMDATDDVNTPDDADDSNDMGDTEPGSEPGEGIVPADTTPAADQPADADGTDAAGTVTGETGNGTTNGGNAEVKADGDTPAAQPVYEIIFNEDGDFESNVTYNGYDCFTDILTYVRLEKDGETVEATGVTCTWKQKGADGVYAAMPAATSPKNAGSYQAVLAYPAQEGVHGGAEKTVDCEIAKAPVTITLEGLTVSGKLPVKPGTKKSDITVPVIDSISGGNNELDKATGDVVLKMEIKNAVTGAAADDVLTKDGDYVMALTPEFKEGLDETKKNNHELKPFTVDIEMEDLIETRVVLTAEPWKQEDGSFLVTKQYDGKPMELKESATEGYTWEVQTLEAGGNWKKLEDADVKVVAKWDFYDDCEYADDGSVKAPTEAAVNPYTYMVVYEGKKGLYAGSAASVSVKINRADLTVEPTNAAPLTVLENSTAAEVLAKIEYKVLDKAGTDVTDQMKADHIWGTGYADVEASQIYEPLFTVEQSIDDGTTWNTMEDYEVLVKDGKYRVAFKGRKAVFRMGWNADGSTYYYQDAIDDINDNYYVDNGVNPNYYTTAAAGKELAVEVKPGTKAVIDVSGLLGGDKGAETLAGLTPKQYDGNLLYSSTSQYKNAVKLTDETGSTTFRTEQREFTYQWAKYGHYDYEEGYYKYDLIDAKIDQANNALTDAMWEDEPMASPRSAGVYRLTISYEDQIDPDTYYYAEPKTVYFAIDPRKVMITPKEQSYEVLEGRSVWEFFNGDKAIEYEVKAKDGKELPKESAVPRGAVLKKTSGTPAVPDALYDQDGWQSQDISFERNTNVAYTLLGVALRYYDREDGEYYDDSDYTCWDSEIVEENGKKKRNDSMEYYERPITVVQMGTEQVTITVDSTLWEAKTKTYDAKPFTLEELVKSGLVTVKKADGTPVTDLKLHYCVPYNPYGEEAERELNNIVNAGTYDLYVRFDGDAAYAPYGWNDAAGYPGRLGVKVGTFSITQREISLTADLEATYQAGTYVSDILSEVRSRYQVENYVKGQEEAFVYKNEDGMLKAWGEYGPFFYVVEAGGGMRLESYEKLARNKTYEVRYDSEYGLSYDYAGWDTENDVSIYAAADYTVKNAPIAAFTTVPGNSTIESVEWGGDEEYIAAIDIVVKNDEKENLKREVKMRQAIGWSRYTLNEQYNSKTLEGNLVAFRFTAPAEYDEMPATAMYRNAVEAAGGYIVETPSYYDDSFTAVFNAAEGDKTVNLRWADGYVEEYQLKFEAADKLEDLEDAVAPKALAFNAPVKKMAVGQEQQLDVKITKEQMGDIIYLGYKSDNPSVLTVNESGMVTALGIGSATITVFPQHLVKGTGKPVPITPAKVATLKIQVTKLDAPKKLKATAHGTYVDLNYDTPAYGYRREIYVAEKSDKFKTALKFEEVLAGMKENQWKEKGFAVAPIYLAERTEKENREDYNYVQRLTGLEIRKDYTIYVRNVCAVRTLDSYEGVGAVTQQAMQESASGAIVNVKTKKAEVQDLSLNVYAPQAAWDYDNGVHAIRWFAGLDKGTLQLNPYGSYPQVTEEGGKTVLLTEEEDAVWVGLPFSKDDKATYKDIYEEPKLEYALICWNKETGSWSFGTKNEYASIDKKGKIKFTGIPTEDSPLYVRVRVTDNHDLDFITRFYFWDQADSVAAAKKSVTLTVGQEQQLSDLLTYSMGKTKLTAYTNRDIDVAKVREAIKKQGKTNAFTVDDGGVLTVLQGGAKLELELTDRNVERKNADKATAKVTINSKDLEAVKGLKACDVSYNNFGLTFNYTGYAKEFRFELFDAKNRMLYSRILCLDNEYDFGGIQRKLVTDKNGKYVYVLDGDGSYAEDSDGNRILSVVKNTYEIPHWFIQDMGINITKESQYTVSLTPVYGDLKAAKAATAKVKTTKIPAYEGYFENEEGRYGNWIWACDKRGGMSIEVSEGYQTLNSRNSTLEITSGNVVTLTANVQHNRGRVSDTLVWSIGDKKVASVKAAAGSYCITLKGLKPGETTLEVRSKILGNKVIARYNIEVEAVGDAQYNAYYYGDNE